MKTDVWVVSLASLAIGTALVLGSSIAIGQQAGATKVSVWSGVYTTAQSKRGEAVHAGACVSCHGKRLNGAGEPDMPPSPGIAREGFLRKWAGKPVSELFVYVRTKMPPDTPGRLTDQESIDAIAHMLAVSNVPAGDKELPSDEKALADFVIEAQPRK
jgi:cytochrome c